MKKILFAAIFQISLAAFANISEVDIAELKTRFSTPVTNNGPNCYNATLISLGYMEEVIHVSPGEMDFYLQEFCEVQDISAAKASRGMVLVFRSPQQLEHTALFLGDGQVFEKYTYEGTRSKNPKMWRSGEYIFQPLSQSLYLTFRQFSKSVFVCASAEGKQRRLATIQLRPWARRLTALRAQLTIDVLRWSPKSLKQFLSESAPLYLEELSDIAHNPPKNSFEYRYFKALVISNVHQIYFMHEGFLIDCPRCEDFSDAKLEESIDRIRRQLR